MLGHIIKDHIIIQELFKGLQWNMHQHPQETGQVLSFKNSF